MDHDSDFIASDAEAVRDRAEARDTLMHPFTIAIKKSSKNLLLPPFLYMGCIVLGMKIKEPTWIILGLEGITPG
jgi:hypothetical protein